MSSAGWGAGGGQQRGADVLTDSEFAEFNFACAVGSAKDWTWQQGYACQSGEVWVSDSSCGTSSGGANGFPPSWQSASSFAWNINTYEVTATYPWDMYVFGTDISVWKSPFSASDPNTVIGLDGYPAATNSDDLSQGPSITYSSTHNWEWPMVYEWSLDLGPSGTDCGSNALYLVTGLSHHSPLKEGTGSAMDKYGEQQMLDWCGEENDCFPEPEGGGDPVPFADWGDLPDTYSTTSANNGPSHNLTVAGPYLGADIQFEGDGQPTTDATGDSSEEDGVLRDMSDLWQPGAAVDLDTNISGSTGHLVAWFDWNDDDSFDEMKDFGSLTTGAQTLNVNIPASYGIGTTVHVRFRIFDPAGIPGGSLDFKDFQGTATGGEVEDYQWPFNTNAVQLVGLRAASPNLISIGLFIALVGLSWRKKKTRS